MMTVGKLYRQLYALIKKGHGNKPICIDKLSFTHPLEPDGAVILGIGSIKGPLFIPEIDDDGGFKQRADGTEAGRMTVVLKGRDEK
jgi:hypothetical protein